MGFRIMAGIVVFYGVWQENNPEINMEDVMAYIDSEPCVDLAFLEEEHKTLHFNFDLRAPDDARILALIRAGYRMGRDYERNNR